MPGTKHLPAIAKILNCSVEWLTTGRGQQPPWAPVPIDQHEAALYKAQQDADEMKRNWNEEKQNKAKIEAELNALKSTLARVEGERDAYLKLLRSQSVPKPPPTDVAPAAPTDADHAAAVLDVLTASREATAAIADPQKISKLFSPTDTPAKKTNVPR